MKYKWSLQIKMRGTVINPIGFDQGHCNSITQNRYSHIFHSGQLSRSKENRGLHLNLPYESMLTYFRLFLFSENKRTEDLPYKSKILVPAGEIPDVYFTLIFPRFFSSSLVVVFSFIFERLELNQFNGYMISYGFTLLCPS